jgi:dTMP kinase
VKGLFITFEGGEGVGKTTQMKKCASLLEKEGRDVLMTREPGGTEIGEEIRKILLNSAYHTLLQSKTELLLYLAARAQHYYEKIEPALKKGKIVLCDRFMDATAAYQGYARQLGLDFTEEMNHWVLNGAAPHCTFFLYTDIRSGLDRESAQNRLSMESEDFHACVLQGYFELARRHPERIMPLDISDKGIDEVNAMIMTQLRRFL